MGQVVNAAAQSRTSGNLCLPSALAAALARVSAETTKTAWKSANWPPVASWEANYFLRSFAKNVSRIDDRTRQTVLRHRMRGIFCDNEPTLRPSPRQFPCCHERICHIGGIREASAAIALIEEDDPVDRRIKNSGERMSSNRSQGRRAGRERELHPDCRKPPNRVAARRPYRESRARKALFQDRESSCATQFGSPMHDAPVTAIREIREAFPATEATETRSRPLPRNGGQRGHAYCRGGAGCRSADGRRDRLRRPRATSP